MGREARAVGDFRHRDGSGDRLVTLLWFIVWLIANTVGGHVPLLLDP